MRFKIHVDGAEHEVEASADGMLTLDGEIFQAKVGRPSDDRRLVQVGDKTYDVRIVEDCADTGIAILELAGERIPLTLTDVAKGAAARTAVAGSGAGTPGGIPSTGAGGVTVVSPPVGEAAAGSRGAAAGAGNGIVEPTVVPDEVRDGIWAPVPGKIVDVFVKAGDVLDEGATVLILEAMKMENELHTPHKGTVAAVLVKKGDQAEKGQLLVAFA